jgi:hydroxyacylglutathione hydrolase
MFHQIKSSWGDNLTYLVGDEGSGKAFVVDTAGNGADVLKFLKKGDMSLEYIIHTHCHPDHTAGSMELAKVTGAKTVIHESSSRRMDVQVKEGCLLRVGKFEVSFIHTPGHTPESMCVLQGKDLFTGDTLFVGECGRTDMPGGDSGALYDSFQKLRKLPDDLVVWPGHDYGGIRSTLGKEKKENYTLKPRDRGAFIRFMAEP